MNPWTKKLIEAASERGEAIVQMHDAQRLTFASIGASLGISKQQAHQLYHRHQRRTKKCNTSSTSTRKP
jgi:DNA-directed RNA polymerase specialized sigma24 family protein